MLKSISTLASKILSLNKSVDQNRAEIKTLTKQLETLAEYLSRQNDRIADLEKKLAVERQKNISERERHELEVKNLKQDLKIKLQEFEISMLKMQSGQGNSSSNNFLGINDEKPPSIWICQIVCVRSKYL